MSRFPIKEKFLLVKKHKFYSIVVGFLFFTFFVSLMSCFKLRLISQILFSGGIFFIAKLLLCIKKIKIWLENTFSKFFINKKDRCIEFIKLTLVLVSFTSVLSISSFCLCKPVQAYAADVVDYCYPKIILNMRDDIINEIKELTGESDSEEKEDINKDYSYIACSSSNFLISTDKKDYEIDESFLYSFFYEINELYRSYEIYDILDENIYSLYNNIEANKPERLKEEVYAVQKIEDDFLEQVDSAKKYDINSTYWKQTVPNSDSLVKICKQRENIIDKGYHDFRFCFLLSNNFQMLADEFLAVSNDANEPFEDYDAVLYYYCQSINADKKALTFSVSVEEKICCLDRIATRYQDISCVKGIDAKTREKAEIISKSINEYLK